ncbi:MAG: TetR/AcrR family transcriptional regulator [Cyanobacteria bacterium SBLK]|nr:TetR/AcrR family transcriptional regulator [Cyanobacteria bacterium SBLK]
MPKIVDAEQYRRVLLNHCFDLFAERGYANVTTRQIAEALGVSTGTLYHYFANKKDLFAQLVEEIARKDVWALQQQIDRDKTLSERIAAFGQILVENAEYLIAAEAIWLDFYQHCNVEETQNALILQRVAGQYQKAIANLLGIDDLKVAHFIHTAIEGILCEQLPTRNSELFVEQVNFLMAMLTAYFEKRAIACLEAEAIA